MSNSLQTHGLPCQAPLSVGFPRQEYWSGLPFSSPIHYIGLVKSITCVHYYSIQSIFVALKILSALPIYPSPRLTHGNLWSFFFVSIVWPFPKCHIIGMILYVFLSDGVLSLKNMRLCFLHIFHGLIAHIFSSLNKTPLSGYPWELLRIISPPV